VVLPRDYKGPRKFVRGSCQELGRFLEMAVQYDLEEITRKEFGLTRRLHV
jgi:hypothetical protein